MCSEPFERWDIPAKVVDRLLWDWSVLNNLTGQSILKIFCKVLQIKSPSYQIFIGAACLHFAIKIKNNNNNLDALHGEIAVEGSPLHVTWLASVLVLLHVLQ